MSIGGSVEGKEEWGELVEVIILDTHNIAIEFKPKEEKIFGEFFWERITRR